MALFGKDDRSQRPEEAASKQPATESKATMTESRPNGAMQASLGPGSHVEGKLKFEGSVQVDGRVNGEIDAKDTVVVGEKAVVKAQVSAGTIIVKGNLTGDVVARKRIELQAPARLTGNITTPSLVIHEGVTFEGNCSMGSSGDKARPQAGQPGGGGQQKR